MQLTVLDIDGSVTGQPLFTGLIARGKARVIDMRALEPRLRIIASHQAHHDLLLALEPIPRDEGPPIVFYGSGDFHHVTASLLAHYDEPLTVIHFDSQPDWVRWPQSHTCGGWVCRALELAHVRRVITLGVGSGKLVRPELKLANLSAVEDGRIEVYPWRHPPSRVYRWHRDTKSTTYDGRYLHWRELADEDWASFLNEMTALLPTEAVYISIDKGVLGESGANAGHTPGPMLLGHVLEALEVIAANCKVVGVDVCGDYSPPGTTDMFPRALVPRRVQRPPTIAELAGNEAANARLLACLGVTAGGKTPMLPLHRPAGS